MKTRLIALKRCWNILEILDGLLVVLLCFRTQESYCSTFWNIRLEHCTMKVYIVCECLHYAGILYSFDYISAMQKDLFQDNTFYKNNKYICKQLKTSQFLLYLLGDSCTRRREWKCLINVYFNTLKKSRSTLVIKWSCFKLLDFSERLSEHELKILLILVIFK